MSLVGGVSIVANSLGKLGTGGQGLGIPGHLRAQYLDLERRTRAGGVVSWIYVNIIHMRPIFFISDGGIG